MKIQATAECLVSELLTTNTVRDPVLQLHLDFLHHAYLYVDLREAIRYENGPHIVCHWKLWLPRFLATGSKKYRKLGNFR